MRLWCNGKRWGLSFVLVCFCICTFCMYRSPCQQLLEMKGKEGWEWNVGKGETPPVRGVCGCSFLGISCVGSWLSRGDSILLFVPCGPGSVRGCESISAILLCHIAFNLVPVSRHRWACLFWLVARTNARGCSFGCIYALWLGRFWSLFLVLFCFYVFFDKGGLIVFITTNIWIDLIMGIYAPYTPPQA